MPVPSGVVSIDQQLKANLGKVIDQHVSWTADDIEVDVLSFADCDQVGAVIAAWLGSTAGDFRLRIDGPGADFTIYMIRTPDDAETVSGLLASAAYLQ